MLNLLGHEVHGMALNPIKNGIFEQAAVGELCSSDIRLDIRNKEALNAEIFRIQPEVVFHLAAQALVLTSYEQVYETYSTNVSGTLNILDSSLKSDSLKGIVVVTTDKVYENTTKKVFLESDPLGGQDPYSSSKALADKLTQKWRLHHSSVPIGIARAGNVIGGGDVSPNRLVPDILRAHQENRVPIIRNPNSVRPWQHVLDCLNGYIKLMDYTLAGHSEIFNFGPKLGHYYSVKDVVEILGGKLMLKNLEFLEKPSMKELDFLALDSTKANKKLNWQNKLSLDQSLNLVLQWNSAMSRNRNLQQIALNQINNYWYEKS